MKYDLIIVGAGPSGIFTALELNRRNPNKRILIIEQGRAEGPGLCRDLGQSLE